VRPPLGCENEKGRALQPGSMEELGWREGATRPVKSKSGCVHGTAKKGCRAVWGEAGVMRVSGWSGGKG